MYIGFCTRKLDFVHENGSLYTVIGFYTQKSLFVPKCFKMFQKELLQRYIQIHLFTKCSKKNFCNVTYKPTLLQNVTKRTFATSHTNPPFYKMLQKELLQRRIQTHPFTKCYKKNFCNVTYKPTLLQNVTKRTFATSHTNPPFYKMLHNCVHLVHNQIFSVQSPTSVYKFPLLCTKSHVQKNPFCVQNPDSVYKIPFLCTHYHFHVQNLILVYRIPCTKSTILCTESSFLCRKSYFLCTKSHFCVQIPI
jgi:hypothetical protein